MAFANYKFGNKENKEKKEGNFGCTRVLMSTCT